MYFIYCHYIQMIRSFKDKLTEDLYHGVKSKKVNKISAEVQDTAVRKLDQLNASFDIIDLKISPGNKLEKLKGNYKDYYSIRVNDQYRIIFQWKNGDAFEVEFIDYH